MAFTKTRDDADRYFSPGNHSRAADWAAYPPAARDGAVAQARRELEFNTGRVLEDPDTDDALLIEGRDDYAVFEQALEVLDRQPRQVTGLKQKRVGEPKEDDRQGFRISPIALQFLRVQRLKWGRG